MTLIINTTKKSFVVSLILFFSFFLIHTDQCNAQSRTTLTQEEIDAVNTQYELQLCGVAADGWEINPDVWEIYSFIERRNFTEKLSVFFKNYTEIGPQMSGFCFFYDMATKKKIARWYKNEYQEY